MNQTDYDLLDSQLRALLGDEPDALAAASNFVALLYNAAFEEQRLRFEGALTAGELDAAKAALAAQRRLGLEDDAAPAGHLERQCGRRGACRSRHPRALDSCRSRPWRPRRT